MLTQLAENHIDKIQFPVNQGKDYIIKRGKYTKMAYGLLDKDWMLAEDCVQESFIKMIEYPAHLILDEMDDMEAYFAVVVRATAYNMRRNDRQKERNNISDPAKYIQYTEVEPDEEERDEIIALVDELTDPEQGAIAGELLNKIKQEIDLVPKKYRNNIALYVLYGHKPREISLITGDSPKRVYNSIQHFRKHMKERLE